MYRGNTPKFIGRWSDFLEAHLLRIEIYAVLLGLLSYLAGMVAEGAQEITYAVTGISLAVVYYIIGFSPRETKLEYNMNRYTYFFFTTAILAILFVGNHWPGGVTVLHFALIGLSVITLVRVILGPVLKKIPFDDQSWLFRSLILLAILLLFMTMPQYKQAKELYDEGSQKELID